MIALRIAHGVRSHLRARWTEWVISGLLFALGLKLLGSGDTFASSPGFSVMAAFATENHWGATICVISGARLLALLVNGTFRSFARISPIVRTVFSVLSGFVWFSISLGLFLGNPDGTGHVTYAGLLIVDVINAVLAGADTGTSERRYRDGCR